MNAPFIFGRSHSVSNKVTIGQKIICSLIEGLKCFSIIKIIGTTTWPTIKIVQ